MSVTKVYSAASSTSPLAPDTIKRREPTDRDVKIDILFCGICHSDLHTVRDEWSSVMPTTVAGVRSFLCVLLLSGLGPSSQGESRVACPG